MHANTEKLHALMRDNRLSVDDVAEMLNREPQTVRQWRVMTGRPRPIPTTVLELLTIKVQARAQSGAGHEPA